jgi:hypothetical protein
MPPSEQDIAEFKEKCEFLSIVAILLAQPKPKEDPAPETFEAASD